MSDISISANSPLSMALENLASGNEVVADKAETAISGRNLDGADSQEQTIAGTEVASRTQDYLASGPDWSSTGSDIEFARAIDTTLDSGIGSIADKVV